MAPPDITAGAVPSSDILRFITKVDDDQDRLERHETITTNGLGFFGCDFEFKQRALGFQMGFEALHQFEFDRHEFIHILAFDADFALEFFDACFDDHQIG